MGSQPIRIQLRKILRENLAGNSCGKILREILVGNSCGKILRENLAGNSYRKILWEILMGNCCGTRRRGKSQFKKGSDWWKFSIWNRVMGSQPIRIQLGKILQENLAGKSCGKFLWENLAGNSCGKFLWENLVGNSCGKFLQENLVGNSCRKFLQENLVGKSCGKFLREILLEILWKMLWDIPHTDSKLFLKVIFKIYNSSRSTLFSLVNLKNSFLKPILNQFSHMTHQVKA